MGDFWGSLCGSSGAIAPLVVGTAGACWDRRWAVFSDGIDGTLSENQTIHFNHHDLVFQCIETGFI